ncbi:outer membrane lipoprotein LolB [Castellaniella caeni]|uniref:outer membrane lipoprotein LolB n=1 Tax=Castellaniella caeni TaxID=266123 RepID=UPI001E416D54|nr:outer membrane lipoprotein LolB [Castellaniella caeni]
MPRTWLGEQAVARLWRLVCVSLLAAGLAACAAPARIAGQGPAFERLGRFAVNLQPVAQAPYAAQGGFSWRDDGRTLRLDLSTPLGSVLARIQVGPGMAVLERADGSRETAASPDDLLERLWGHPMPVAGLRDWMRGAPEPGQPVLGAQRDEQGRLTRFQQNGWDVRLSSYDDQGPRRIRLFRQDAQGEWRLQFLVDHG